MTFANYHTVRAAPSTRIVVPFGVGERLIIQDQSMGYAAVVGSLSQNHIHRHYAMHLALGIEAEIELETDSGSHGSHQAVVIARWKAHRLSAAGPALILSLAPISNLGLHLERLLDGHAWAPLNHPGIAALRTLAGEIVSGAVEPSAIAPGMAGALRELEPEPFAVQLARLDPRILRALAFLADGTQEFVPAGRVASEVALSESRFLHLFRRETGITFRRMQLWIRLVHAFGLIADGLSLTEIAHACGFSDSAHFTRAFHQAFGMAPSVLIEGSRFIQADAGAPA